MKIILIIAIDKNGVMGKNNDLPWRLSTDLKSFKKETDNFPLIMGSNTFKSLPGILPNREHIVLSSNMFGDENKSVFTSIKETIDYLKESEYEKAFLIGGANLIRQFTHLKLVDEMIITHVDTVINDADTIIDIDIDLELHKWSNYYTESYSKDEKNEYDFTIKKYVIKNKRFY